MVNIEKLRSVPAENQESNILNLRCRRRRRKNHHYTCLVCFAEFSSSIQYDEHKAQHNTGSNYCISDSEEVFTSNSGENDNPIDISSPTNFDETPVTEVDPLDISIILENSTDPDTIVIDEDPLSPDIITVDKDSEQESAIEPLFINSSPEVSNDRPDIVSYDFNCDICYDIFCTKEELESHMEMHSQIQDKNKKSKESDNISAETSGNRIESRDKSLQSISENTSPNLRDNMSQVGSPQESSINNDNIDSFMSNFLRPASKKSPDICLETQKSVVHNFTPEIIKRSVVPSQEQVSEIPINNNLNTQNQVYYMNPQTIGSNQSLVSDAAGNLYLVVGCSVANGEIQNVINTAPTTASYQETTTPIQSPNFVMNHIPVAPHDNVLGSASQSVNASVNDRSVISLARLNQNIEQMMAKNSNALMQSVVPQKTLKKNVGKKVLRVKKIFRSDEFRNEVSTTTDFEIIEDPCSTQPAKRKANILKKKFPSRKKVHKDWIHVVQPISSDDSNGFASRGPFSYVDHQQEDYSHYSNLKSALLHGSTGLTFETPNQSLSSQEDVVHVAAESEIPPPPVRKPRVIINPLPPPAGKVPTVDRILMPKITNVMSMNNDIMESDSITVLSDEETEVATNKIISGLNTDCDDDEDDIERALPMSLIYRPGPDAENDRK